jgi:hypothetical protein
MATNALVTLGVLVVAASAHVQVDAAGLMRSEISQARRGEPANAESKADLESKVKDLEHKLQQAKKQASSAASVSAGASTGTQQRTATRHSTATIPDESSLDVDEQQDFEGCESMEFMIKASGSTSEEGSWCEEVCTQGVAQADRDATEAGFAPGRCKDPERGYTQGSLHHVATFTEENNDKYEASTDLSKKPTPEQVAKCKNRDVHIIKNDMCQELCLHTTGDETSVVNDMASFEPGPCPPAKWSKYVGVTLVKFWMKGGGDSSTTGTSSTTDDDSSSTTGDDSSSTTGDDDGTD